MFYNISQIKVSLKDGRGERMKEGREKDKKGEGENKNGGERGSLHGIQ